MDIGSIAPAGQPPPPPFVAISTPADDIDPVVEDARQHFVFAYWTIPVIVLGVVVLITVVWVVKYFTAPTPKAPASTLAAAPTPGAAAAPTAEPEIPVWVAPPPIAHYFPRQRRAEIQIQRVPDQLSEDTTESTTDLAESSHAHA